jgi:ubiquitin-protein ligase
MNYSIKKLQKELQELQLENDLPFTVGLQEEDSLFKWNVVIIGQENTLYEGSILNALIVFPQNYPFEPP